MEEERSNGCFTLKTKEEVASGKGDEASLLSEWNERPRAEEGQITKRWRQERASKGDKFDKNRTNADGDDDDDDNEGSED